MKVRLVVVPVLLIPAAVDECSLLNVDQRAVFHRKFDRVTVRSSIAAGLCRKTAGTGLHERSGPGELECLIVCIDQRVASRVIVRFRIIHDQRAVDVDRDVLRLADENVFTERDGRAGAYRDVLTPSGSRTERRVRIVRYGKCGVCRCGK